MIRTTRCGQFCTAKSPGAPKGNTNAFKHGRYSAETIEARRKIAADHENCCEGFSTS